MNTMEYQYGEWISIFWSWHNGKIQIISYIFKIHNLTILQVFLHNFISFAQFFAHSFNRQFTNIADPINISSNACLNIFTHSIVPQLSFIDSTISQIGNKQQQINQTWYCSSFFLQLFNLLNTSYNINMLAYFDIISLEELSVTYHSNLLQHFLIKNLQFNFQVNEKSNQTLFISLVVINIYGLNAKFPLPSNLTRKEEITNFVNTFETINEMSIKLSQNERYLTLFFKIMIIKQFKTQMSHLTKSKSQQEIHFDELFSRIMKIGAKENQQKTKIESTGLYSSLKLEPITLTGKSKNSSKIHKINSINTQSSQSFIEKDERMSQKKKQNPIYLQKLKLVLAKNESLLASPNSNKMEEKDSPLKSSTLRQLIRIDNQRKKESILRAVENLKLEMNSA